MAQLERMTTAELRELSARIEVEIAMRKRRKTSGSKRGADAAKTSARGMKSGGRRVKGFKPGGVLYRNPADPSLIWAGRGRRPKWLAKASDMEKFRVK